MLRWIYLYRNLTRNVTRTVLTCAAVGLPIVIFVISMAVIDGVELFLSNSAKQLRLTITQKTSIINPLPEGHRRKIESLDETHRRILSVCGLRWIGGQRLNDPMPLSSIGVDADTFVTTFPEENLTPEEVEAWKRDKQAIIIGRSTAMQCGWKVGDRITINPSVPPYVPIEFHVISTAEKGEDPVTLFFRRDYFEEIVKSQQLQEGLVSFYFVKCASKADMDYYRQEIDKLFAGSLDETRTQDEKTFMNEFITQQFDLPKNLTILSALTIFVAVIAAMNTMSMNFRDRISEIATLKSLGFSGRFNFSMIQIESLLLCVIGGVIGALGPYIAFMHTPLKKVTIPIIQSLQIMPITCFKAFGIAVFIGLAAGVWPSWLALRMKVVSALRNLE
jgi:putative ABC transport system permease protein